jgi:hypothetical protein
MGIEFWEVLSRSEPRQQMNAPVRSASQARQWQLPSSSVMRSARLAVGFLLSVLPTAAVAVEGTYRDVGPWQRHPLHASPVPAWITLATVSRVGANSFKVRVTTCGRARSRPRQRGS